LAAIPETARGPSPQASGRRIHFYTLNQAEPTLKLWKNLGLPTPC
jgi:5,10-methylenetetrahydrofolate reductase